jgi:hypothetical protein
MTAARYLALSFGMVAALLLALSAAADERALSQGWLAWWPECPARRAGASCALCGMSHSFVAMSRGRVREASKHNSAGPWLYALCCAQFIAAILLLPGTFRCRRCLPKRTG